MEFDYLILVIWKCCPDPSYFFVEFSEIGKQPVGVAT
jgi:hypothetical protein